MPRFTDMAGFPAASWTGWFEQRIPSSVCCTCRTTIPPACPNFNVSTRVSERESRYICLAKLKHDSFGSQTLTYWQKTNSQATLAQLRRSESTAVRRVVEM